MGDIGMNDKNLVFHYFKRKVRDPKLYQHSIRVAEVAYHIGKYLDVDEDRAYCYGLLHDIGKTSGSSGLRHTYAGYKQLCNLNIIDRPDICLTHSFPLKNAASYMGENDCTEEEYGFVKNYIDNCEYSLFDRIIQLADAIAGADGCMILEISMVKVALKYKVNDYTIDSWKEYFRIYDDIEKLLGNNVYSVLNQKVQGYNS